MSSLPAPCPVPLHTPSIHPSCRALMRRQRAPPRYAAGSAAGNQGWGYRRQRTTACNPYVRGRQTKKESCRQGKQHRSNGRRRRLSATRSICGAGFEFPSHDGGGGPGTCRQEHASPFEGSLASPSRVTTQRVVSMIASSTCVVSPMPREIMGRQFGFASRYALRLFAIPGKRYPAWQHGYHRRHTTRAGSGRGGGGESLRVVSIYIYYISASAGDAMLAVGKSKHARSFLHHVFDKTEVTRHLDGDWSCRTRDPW